MSIGLKILSGPRQGEKFRLHHGLTIGRKKALISIDDPKVSALHATISQDEMGRWYIVDNNSRNGTKVDDVVVRQAYLNPGMKFQVGDSVFKVVELEQAPAQSPTTDTPKDSAPPPAPIKQAPEHWSQSLLHFFEQNSERFKDQIVPLKPLSPALTLKFLRGTQADTEWLVGYGPRVVGSQSMDLMIWEPEAPDVCFEIHPNAQGIELRSKYSDKVSVNGQPLSRKIVADGDRIDILNTTIEIRFHREANS